MDTVAKGENVAEIMTAPDKNGTPMLPKRTNRRGLMPSTWIDRSVTVEYVVAGTLRTTTGTLADLFPAGLVLNVGGHRTLISWDALAVVELVGD